MGTQPALTLYELDERETARDQLEAYGRGFQPS